MPTNNETFNQRQWVFIAFAFVSGAGVGAILASIF